MNIEHGIPCHGAMLIAESPTRTQYDIENEVNLH